MFAIEQFDRAVRYFPDRPVVVSSSGAITYREMAAIVDRLANALIASDLDAGARISIVSLNHPMVLACQYAIMKAGCVWVPSNFRDAPADTARRLRTMDVSFVFCHSSLLAGHIEAVRELIPELKGVVSLDGPAEGVPGLLEWADGFAPGAVMPRRTMSDPVAIMTTGGTTGVPKGAVHTNRSWECNTAAYLAMFKFKSPPVHLVVTPLTHAAGVLHWALAARGATHVLCPDADPGTILRMIEQHRVNVLFLPPTVIYMLLAHPDLTKYDYSSLEHLIFGSAPMSLEKLKEALVAFGPIMSQIYGSAEVLMMASIQTGEDLGGFRSDPAMQKRIASAGREGPFARVEIIDDEGNFLPPETPGEIVIRGEFTMAEYYRDPVRTTEALVDGWYRSGDIGYKDEAGYLYIVDRKNDMIISGGFNIYPSEVEQAVLSHPAIQDGVVVGIPHEKWGEAVLAAVEVKAGFELDEAEFLAFCRARLGGVKAPKFVEVVAALPRSSVGKTLRRAVRARHWEGRATAI